jgi:hypothetical protein
MSKKPKTRRVVETSFHKMQENPIRFMLSDGRFEEIEICIYNRNESKARKLLALFLSHVRGKA